MNFASGAASFFMTPIATAVIARERGDEAEGNAASNCESAYSYDGSA